MDFPFGEFDGAEQEKMMNRLKKGRGSKEGP